jgi:hypothetical protein
MNDTPSTTKERGQRSMHVYATASKWDATFATQEAKDEGLDDLLHLSADNEMVDCSWVPSALATAHDESVDFEAVPRCTQGVSFLMLAPRVFCWIVHVPSGRRMCHLH